ncbi:guanine deaminase [Jiangella sp. DSM 45060]|uniref:guanine deaminase n=1 Tax=Jiangella sp. DSM 45060 TaxID=1798224 RepID=UPI00087A7B09|nr:guanine deaminase [Jiangella sp. DSM 45060]SDS18721.1 guanine deaminase [Jiangella sp. DSM 45060]
MTIYRGAVLDTPESPFAGGKLRSSSDEGIVVRDGVIVARGPFAALRREHPDEDLVALDGGLLLPGFVDTHVHFPQVRVIGGIGLPLLDWLERRALPEEGRLADAAYAAQVAADFVSGLVTAGTTAAMVFGSHFPAAVEALFESAAAAGPRVTSGLVVSDRNLPAELLSSPGRAYEESVGLARRWHGTGRARYAVTPRFSLSSTDALLATCAAVLDDVPGAFVTSHVNENVEEIEQVKSLFRTDSYVATYDRHGLLGRHSVLAHNVHPGDDELETLAARGSSVAHCPTSNAALGSGLFPLARHLRHGVAVALGSDVGAGSGFSLLKEGLQAYFTQQQLGPDGYALTPAHLLHLATAAGAAALDLPDVGHLSVGQRFDAQWLRPAPGSTYDAALRNAAGPDDALGITFTLGTATDVAAVWIDGVAVR